MRQHSPDKTLSGATTGYECRICGADHDDRHTECPECGLTPFDFYDGTWGSKGKFADEHPENGDFPFRTDTGWASRRIFD